MTYDQVLRSNPAKMQAMIKGWRYRMNQQAQALGLLAHMAMAPHVPSRRAHQIRPEKMIRRFAAALGTEHWREAGQWLNGQSDN